MTLFSLKTLLLANTLTEFGVGVFLLFMPKQLSNPLSSPDLVGEWDGGVAIQALRPICGISCLAMGVLTLLEAYKPEGRKTPESILAYLTMYHTLLCIPVVTHMGFAVTQIPTLLGHLFLALGFGGHFLSEVTK